MNHSPILFTECFSTLFTKVYICLSLMLVIFNKEGYKKNVIFYFNMILNIPTPIFYKSSGKVYSLQNSKNEEKHLPLSNTLQTKLSRFRGLIEMLNKVIQRGLWRRPNKS